MKKLIVTSLLSLSTLVCFSQDIYKVKVNSLEVGRTITDSTSIWSDSVLISPPTILINKDTLFIKSNDTQVMYKFLSVKKSNHGINSFYSIESGTNKTCVVTYFTSPCLDTTSITVIIDDGKDSYNYRGKIE